MRSVPADTRVRRVWMRSWPGRTTGQGISATSVSPVLRLWRICFIISTAHRLEFEKLFENHFLAGRMTVVDSEAQKSTFTPFFQLVIGLLGNGLVYDGCRPTKPRRSPKATAMPKSLFER